MTTTAPQADQVECALMSDVLREFRLYLEGETGLPISNVEMNGALLLFDLCQFLGLDDTNQTKVLGPTGRTFTHQFVRERFTLRERTH